MWVWRRACGLGKEVGRSWQGNFWGRFRSLLLWEDFGGFFVRRVVCGTEEFGFLGLALGTDPSVGLVAGLHLALWDGILPENGFLI